MNDLNELLAVVSDLRGLLLEVDPTITLKKADSAELAAIRHEWPELPEAFLNFHERFGRGSGIHLDAPVFGCEVLTTNRLLQAQAEYHTDDHGNDLIDLDEWAESWVVIARETHLGDPFVVDLCDPDGPVFHIERSDTFGLRAREAAADFTNFLMMLFVVVEEIVLPPKGAVYDPREQVLLPPVASTLARRIRDLDPHADVNVYGCLID